MRILAPFVLLYLSPCCQALISNLGVTALQSRKKEAKAAVKIWCYLNLGVFVTKMTLL